MTQTTITACASFAAPSLASRRGSAAPASYAAAPAAPGLAIKPQVRESIAMVAGSGLANHSHKRFGMAGTDTDTDVWPLGPQEWMTG